jgi:hypothetical protein
MHDLDSRLALNLDDAHRKLNVKFGRGLLLYGPQGTGECHIVCALLTIRNYHILGKSELLERAAILAGITMTTIPLAAGELNRLFVVQWLELVYRSNRRSNKSESPHHDLLTT